MKGLLLICLALAALLAGCAPTVYGVPQETWERMSDTERAEVRHTYEREQEARRRAAQERARQEALAREQERARQAALERERVARIEAIHRGEGAYGELLRVRLQGGRIKVGGRHLHYEPLTFTIADGETRKIAVADWTGREVDLAVTYAGGALSMEGVRFPYDRSWGRGRLYPDTTTAGPLELRGVDLFIEVHDRSSRFERERPRLVVRREEPPPPPRSEPPPVVVSRDRTPPQPVVRGEAPPEPPKPPPAVVRGNEQHKPGPTERPPVQTRAEVPPRQVEVVLLAGEMHLRGEKLKLERTSLRIAEGERRELTVKAGEEKATVMLQYRNGELVIDGTQRRGRDLVRLPFDKEWQAGKTYRLGLKAKVPLEKVELKVTAVKGQ